MSDGLTTRKGGKVEMTYVGPTPWHGRGQQLQPGQPMKYGLKRLVWIIASCPL